jgi:thioredoxin 1
MTACGKNYARLHVKASVAHARGQNSSGSHDPDRYARIITEAGGERGSSLWSQGRHLEPFCMSADSIKHVSDATFDKEVSQSDRPVLVDYWAEWCGPCRMIAPILEEVSKDYSGRLQVAKMNVDENQQVPAKFGIRGIPTLMLFKGGELVATKVGALPKAQLTAFLDGHL